MTMQASKIISLFFQEKMSLKNSTKTLLSSMLIIGLQVPVAVTAHNIDEKTLGGHELILVKGFDNTPQKDSGALPPPLSDHVDFGFNFPMDKHIDEEDGAGRALYKYLKQNNKCAESCVLFNVSTGDLVTRYFIENQKYWAMEDGIEPFNVVATIDFVGAGGGVEAAEFGHLGSVMDYLYDFIGNSFLGPVAQDLIPSHARNIANNFYSHGVPRFRISANFLETAGAIFPFMPSLVNDGLVAAHSTCGVNKQALFINSCVDNVNYYGETKGSLIPNLGPNQFGAKQWDYHYPVIMTSGLYNHATIGLNIKQGGITHINKTVNKDGVGFNFSVDNTEIYGPYYPVQWGWKGSWPFRYWGVTKWDRDLIYRKQWIKGNSVNEIIHDKFVGKF